MTVLRAIDIETTGLDPDDRIVEIGWSTVSLEDGGWTVSPPSSIITNPNRPIAVEAMATHHITDEEAAAGADIEDVLARALDGADVLVAHVAKFERQFIKTDKPFICTWKVACHLAPQAPAHSLQVLRYWLKLAVDPDEAMPPHRAGPDAYVCAHLIVRILGKLSVQEMIEISYRPALLPKLRFGEHANKPMAEVPKSYLRWILTKDFDEDVKYTANKYLERK